MARQTNPMSMSSMSSMSSSSMSDEELESQLLMALYGVGSDATSSNIHFYNGYVFVDPSQIKRVDEFLTRNLWFSWSKDKKKWFCRRSVLEQSLKQYDS